MRARRRRITVVNDSPEFLDLMHELLEEESGYDVTTIDGDLLHDIEPIRNSKPQLLVVDLRLRRERIAGWEILMALRADDEMRELPTILCTGDLYGLEEHAEAIAQDPLVRTLPKPFRIDELKAAVHELIGEPTVAA
jgi:CheY-like chemotaxis protein